MTIEVADVLSELDREIVALRRMIHKHAEVGHTEFWTTAFIVENLRKWGYSPQVGETAIHRDSRMGVPSDDVLDAHITRALKQGADPETIKNMDGLTGCYADVHPKLPPTIALRFDIDANDLSECKEQGHRPFVSGFVSRNDGACHACGHDAHTAIGLGLAKVLASDKNRIQHNVRLIFQPAEEGVRGAHAMVEAGVLDQVRYFLCCHLGVTALQAGELVCQTEGLLATKKLDVTFKGHTAHAGMSPHIGKNSLLAAASTVMNLHAISRHGEGASRIAVGTLHAGEGRNVIPGEATMQLEVRGATSQINDYMYRQAIKIIEHTAAIYDQEVRIKLAGSSESAESDDAIAAVIAAAADQVPFFKSELRRKRSSLGGSEDATTMMRKVQHNGGKAGYVLIGTELCAGHHHFRFDINESVLRPAVALLYNAVVQLDHNAR